MDLDEFPQASQSSSSSFVPSSGEEYIPSSQNDLFSDDSPLLDEDDIPKVDIPIVCTVPNLWFHVILVMLAGSGSENNFSGSGSC
jgi:hypothetical protein